MVSSSRRGQRSSARLGRHTARRHRASSRPAGSTRSVSRCRDGVPSRMPTDRMHTTLWPIDHSHHTGGTGTTTHLHINTEMPHAFTWSTALEPISVNQRLYDTELVEVIQPLKTPSRVAETVAHSWIRLYSTKYILTYLLTKTLSKGVNDMKF